VRRIYRFLWVRNLVFEQNSQRNGTYDLVKQAYVRQEFRSRLLTSISILVTSVLPYGIRVVSMLIPHFLNWKLNRLLTKYTTMQNSKLL
jgi:hypothetical protein